MGNIFNPKITLIVLIIGSDRKKMTKWLEDELNIFIYDPPSSLRTIKKDKIVYFINTNLITTNQIVYVLNQIDNEKVKCHITYILMDNCITMKALNLLRSRLSEKFTCIELN